MTAGEPMVTLRAYYQYDDIEYPLELTLYTDTVKLCR